MADGLPESAELPTHGNQARAGDTTHRYGCSAAGCTAFATKTEHYWTSAHGWVRGDDYCDEHAPMPSEYVKVGAVSRG